MQYPSLADLGWGPAFASQVTAGELSDCVPARVVAAHKTSYELAGETGSFTGVLAGKLLHEVEASRDLPVAGDWVLVRPPEGGPAVITRRLERRTELSRRRPLDRAAHRTSGARQVLASNLDLVFIVTSLDHDLSAARLERALALVWSGGATPVVLLSKADLCADAEARQLALGDVTCGVDVHLLATLAGMGLEVVRGYFRSGLTACLIGSSGVGKTTLMNALCGTARKTVAVRTDDGRGRHATTDRALFFLPGGGMLIDTPGLREIGLLDEHDLGATFADIAALAVGCQFADCTHQVEPGCAVLSAVASGALAPERHQDYLKLCRELDYQASRDSVQGQQERKRKGKELAKRIKDYYKHP